MITATNMSEWDMVAKELPEKESITASDNVLAHEYGPLEFAINTAMKYCAEHPEWEMLCNIANSERYQQTFEDLPPRVRMSWHGKYKSSAKEAWKEFGCKGYLIPVGYATSDGRVVHSFSEIGPHNFMMIMRTEQTPMVRFHQAEAKAEGQQMVTDYGYTAPRKTRTACKTPAFADPFLHRVGLIRKSYHTDGIRGWIVEHTCVNCRKVFAKTFYAT